MSKDAACTASQARMTRTETKRKRRRYGPKPAPPYTCFCGKVFKRHEHMLRHRATHDDSVRYECNICGKWFRRQDVMHRHTLTHSSAHSTAAGKTTNRPATGHASVSGSSDRHDRGLSSSAFMVSDKGKTRTDPGKRDEEIRTRMPRRRTLTQCPCNGLVPCPICRNQTASKFSALEQRYEQMPYTTYDQAQFQLGYPLGLHGEALSSWHTSLPPSPCRPCSLPLHSVGMASPPPPPPFFQHHEAMALPAFGSLVSTPGRNTSSTSLPAESLQGSEWGYDSPARCDESDSAVWSRTGVAEATLDRAHSVMGATSGTADTSAGHHYPSFYSSELVDSPANRYTALQADAFAAWQGRSLPSGRLSVSVPRSELGVELWEGVGTMSKSAPRWLSQAADAFASSNAAHEVYGGTSSSHSFPTFGSHLMRVSTDEPMMVQTPTHLHPQLQTGRYGHSAAAATATVYDAQASASEAREQQGPVPSDSRDTLRDPFGSASPLTDFSVDPPRPGSSQGAATTSFATHGSFPSATVAPQHFGGPSPAPHQQLQHHLIRNNHGSDHASANASASGFGHSYSSSSSIDPSLMHTSFDMPHFSLPPSAAWS